MSRFSLLGMGWRRDTPDFRDYTPGCSAVQKLMSRLPEAPSQKVPKVDLREFFWPVEDQGSQQYSTACACLALLEYFQERARGHTQRASRLFLYGTTRKLMRVRGDSGADLRTTIKALVRFGVPPESYCPPNQGDCDACVNDPLLYGFGSDYRSITYVRLDPPNVPGSVTLEIVKSYLAAGFPCVLGFPVPSSVHSSGHVPYRPTLDSVVGGQAAVAVGYDDGKRAATKGALIVRNSWGSTWGDNGYGWLPYTYVEKQLAVDFWTLLHKQWLASGEFLRPVSIAPVAEVHPLSS